jgi:hypothetical protein
MKQSIFNWMGGGGFRYYKLGPTLFDLGGVK